MAFFTLTTRKWLHGALCQLLQFIIADNVFKCAVLMDLLYAGKLQTEIAGIGLLIEASSRHLYYKWTLEEIGWPGYL